MLTKTNNLTERAMLVSLSIGYWEGRRKDKGTSEEVTNAKGAEADAIAVWLRTVDRNELKPIFQVVTKGRMLHKKLTLPWYNDGTGILSSDMFLDYTKQMRNLKDEYEKVVAAFLTKWEEIVEHGRKRLGKAFANDLYPTASKLRSKFTWHVHIQPLPTSKDFRVDLGDVTADLKKEMDEEMDEILGTAMMSVWERLYEVINKAAESLAKPEKIFRNTLINNVKEMAEMLPKLNVTNDANLEKMRLDVIKRLSGKNPEELRNNPQERAAAAKTAKDMLSTMEEYMGTKAGEDAEQEAPKAKKVGSKKNAKSKKGGESE